MRKGGSQAKPHACPREEAPCQETWARQPPDAPQQPWQGLARVVGQAESNLAAQNFSQPLGLMRHARPVQAELLPHPRKGLGGIEDGLRADKETFTG